MRPTTLTALAACALMLVGCSATASAPEPAETPSASAVQPVLDSEVAEQPVGSLIDYVESGLAPEEYGFTVFAHSQIAGSDVELPTIGEVVTALHDFCDDGTPFDVSDELNINKSLTKVAKSDACEPLANPQN